MSLVGFRAKNHPQQATRDDVDDRRTPPAIFDPLHSERRFTIDVAASAENALLPRFWTYAEDGRAQAWWKERVWCNPPYSYLEPWLKKAWRAMEHEGCESVTMLLPANRCEQKWWQTHVEPRRDSPSLDGLRLTTRFLAGRPRFGWPADRVVPVKGDRPPFGLVVLTWEREPELVCRKHLENEINRLLGGAA